METQKNVGGARPGSGRKKLFRVGLTVRLTPEADTALKSRVDMNQRGAANEFISTAVVEKAKRDARRTP